MSRSLLYRICQCSRPRLTGPVSERSALPWPLFEFWRRCFGTKIWASVLFLSCPTKRARSAWRVCSASWAFILLRASFMSPRTQMSWLLTKNQSPVRYWKRASMRQGHLLRGWRPRPRIQPINTPCCRFTSTTPCSVFSALAIWRGLLAICKPRAFCWAVLPGARR